MERELRILLFQLGLTPFGMTLTMKQKTLERVLELFIRQVTSKLTLQDFLFVTK